MQLFKNRPLCFACMLFSVLSLLATGVFYDIKIIIMLFLSVCAVALAVLAFILKRQMLRILAVLFCVVAVVGAFANTAFRIDAKQRKADGYVGEQRIVCDIVSKKYSSQGSSSYGVDIVHIGDDGTSFKGVLVFSFPTELSVGDRVYAISELSGTYDKTGRETSYENDELLVAKVYDSDNVFVEYFDSDAPFFEQMTHPMGVTVFVDRMKSGIKARIVNLFGDDNGAIVSGILLGDTSDIPTEVIRNFRRSGVSHLLAVSGMHVSILLGAIDLLLRRLYVHKNIRCVTVTVLSVALLALTGFSMSAARSVFMLWIVYIVFAFSEEADPPTTLFVALSAILIIFPFSVFSLGMWMSFIATLGLVTVYPLFEKLIPHKKRRSTILNLLIRGGKGILLVTAMTVISNVFLLPIQWYFFGELSLIAVPTNILLSTLTTFYMIFSVIAIVFGGIPFLGTVLVNCIDLMTYVIFWITERFSYFDLATVSLGYWFTDILVVLFTVAMIVLLVIKLPRKWMIAIPAASFALIFSASVLIYNACDHKSATFYGSGEEATVSACDGNDLYIIDMSDGDYYNYNKAFYDAKASGATLVESIIFTDITKNHISSMDYFLRYARVKEIYIPIPDSKDPDAIELAIRMTELAVSCNTEVRLYGSSEQIKLGDMELILSSDEYNESTFRSAFISEGDGLFAYVESVEACGDDNVKEYLRNSDMLIIGNHGDGQNDFLLPELDDTTLIYMSSESSAGYVNLYNREKTYESTSESLELIFEFD